jgi:hypothetical protein
MLLELFFTNVPHDCSDLELKEWIESSGTEITSIRIIRDLVSGASPAFAYATIGDVTQIGNVVSALNGKRMRNQIICVSKARSRSVSV